MLEERKCRMCVGRGVQVRLQEENPGLCRSQRENAYGEEKGFRLRFIALFITYSAPLFIYLYYFLVRLLSKFIVRHCFCSLFQALNHVLSRYNNGIPYFIVRTYIPMYSCIQTSAGRGRQKLG